jgi:hypothetical protein
VEVAQLTLHVVEAANLLGESALEGGRLGIELASSVLAAPLQYVRAAHISEVHDAELSKRRDDLAANLVRDVELGQGHVRRAEHGVLLGCHGGGRETSRPAEACLSRGAGGARAAR